MDLTKYIEETVFNFDYAFNEESTNEEVFVPTFRFMTMLFDHLLTRHSKEPRSHALLMDRPGQVKLSQ